MTNENIILTKLLLQVLPTSFVIRFRNFVILQRAESPLKQYFITYAKTIYIIFIILQTIYITELLNKKHI